MQSDDAEISRRLALAIGWPEENVCAYEHPKPGCEIWRDDGEWRTFDYRDPAVIWPIAERFDCFPWLVAPNAKDPWASKLGLFTEHADTAAKAVALAVIAAKGG